MSRPTQGPTCRFTRTGLSPTLARLSRRFRFRHIGHWPGPRSLAATNGVSVDVLSSGYLDVSVRRVRFVILCIQMTMTHKGPGFPIRKSADQSLLATPHGLSQRATSFIASRCQGIHQMLLKRLIQQNPSRVGKKPLPTPNSSATIPDNKPHFAHSQIGNQPTVTRPHKQFIFATYSQCQRTI